MKKLGLLFASLLVTFTVFAQTQTCTNSAGVFTFTPTVSVNPPPPTTSPPAGTAWGYYGGQFLWAGDYSYNVSLNYKDVNGGPLSGSNDLAVKLTGPWGAWQPYMSTTWSYPTTGYTKLTFALKPTVVNQQWQIRFIGVGDVSLPSACNLDVLKYGPAPTVGHWATYVIPLADLCVLGKNVYKFAIQDETGLIANTWYVDNVGFAP